MRSKNRYVGVTAALVTLVSILTLNVTKAQTILSGDHIVEGALEIGTVTHRGGITITGGTGSAANPSIKVTGDGGVLFEGMSGVGGIPREGPGVRMMWYPGKAAFRVGALSPSMTVWDDQYIGFSSVAFGNSTSQADYSTAMSGGNAYNSYSTAMSWGETYAAYSTAMSGGGTDGAGAYSTAMSGGWAFNSYSTAMSGGETDGAYSTAMSGGKAFNDYSTAMSGGVTLGHISTAMSNGLAEGDNSIAGGSVRSRAYNSIAFGSFNVVDEDESLFEWVETDPIFIIGNGTGNYNDPPEMQRRNALVIRKNGNFEMNGNVEMMAKVKMPRQGDILMGEFGETE